MALPISSEMACAKVSARSRTRLCRRSSSTARRCGSVVDQAREGLPGGGHGGLQVLRVAQHDIALGLLGGRVDDGIPLGSPPAVTQLAADVQAAPADRRQTGGSITS